VTARTLAARPPATGHPVCILAGPAAARAAAAVREVATRLADPVAVASIAGRPDNVDPVYRAPLWEPMALSHGHPGIALLHGELARYDPAWAPAAHAHLTAATAAMPFHPSNGLYYGPAAVAVAAQTCAGPDRHYGRLRRRLLDWVARTQSEQITAWTGRRARGEPGVAWSAYDVVNGVTGTARLLLDAAEDPDESSDTVISALTASLKHLVALTEPLQVDRATVPGWWVPTELEPVAEDQRTYPRGDFNLGLAHGAPGPLMLLTLAAERGHTVPGQHEAIHTLATWLRSWTLRDQVGPYWPARVSFEDQTATARPEQLFTRSAWCYGTPGVAAALHRAGTLLQVPDWCAVAVESLRAVLVRDPSQWRLDGPTVCHGQAGLLQVLHRVGVAAAEPDLLDGARRVAELILDQADPAAPFLFQHRVPDSPQGWQQATATRALDIAGMLEGAAGTACALLAVTPASSLAPTQLRGPGTPPATGSIETATTTDRSWDRALLLS
jgi:hypothetical protein